MFTYLPTTLGRLLKRLPRRHTYVLFRIQASLLASGARVSSEFRCEQLSRAHMADIEEVRPGYSHTAERYLDGGDIGLGVWHGKDLAGLIWTAINTSPSPRDIGGCYDLYPNVAYMHAAWTNPEYRGRGLHKQIMGSMAELFVRVHHDMVVEAIVDISNDIAMGNLRKIGWSPSGRLEVIRWGRFRHLRRYDFIKP